jgi:small subunit ribosomal protein S6
VEDNGAVTLYETLYVVHPERGPRLKEFIERFKKVIEGQEGTVADIEEWGMRDLAYRIDNQVRGIYTLMRYRATGQAVQELERNLKLTDGILRYLTVRAEERTERRDSQAAQSQPEEAPRAPEEPSAKPESSGS